MLFRFNFYLSQLFTNAFLFNFNDLEELWVHTYGVMTHAGSFPAVSPWDLHSPGLLPGKVQVEEIRLTLTGGGSIYAYTTYHNYNPSEL